MTEALFQWEKKAGLFLKYFKEMAYFQGNNLTLNEEELLIPLKL